MSFTVNWEMALDSVNHNRSLLRLVIDAFLRESTVFREQLSTAIRTDDPKLLQRSGHTLKGTMMSLGAESWAQLAQQLEELGSTETMEGAAALVARLEETIPSLLEQLDTFSVEQSI